MPTALTRVYALLGDPVSHSLSPTFQNAALRHCGIDAVYVALRCDGDALVPLIRTLCRAGGGGNVTVPHKEAAAACAQRATAAVRRTGACNTFWGEAGVICCDNTDVDAFRAAALELLPALHGARVLILGAGGAAAAAACALQDGGAADVLILSRSPDRAATLARRFAATAGAVRPVQHASGIAGEAFDLVVNATPLGLRSGDPLPLDLAALRRVTAALDLVYSPAGATAWVSHARAHGAVAADGTGMLLGQGAAAFSRWFGIDAPLSVMHASLDASVPRQ
jgi:shikimate dehydrogenase